MVFHQFHTEDLMQTCNKLRQLRQYSIRDGNTLSGLYVTYSYRNWLYSAHILHASSMYSECILGTLGTTDYVTSIVRYLSRKPPSSPRITEYSVITKRIAAAFLPPLTYICWFLFYHMSKKIFHFTKSLRI